MKENNVERSICTALPERLTTVLTQAMAEMQEFMKRRIPETNKQIADAAAREIDIAAKVGLELDHELQEWTLGLIVELAHVSYRATSPYLGEPDE